MSDQDQPGTPRRRGNRSVRRETYQPRDMVDVGRLPAYIRDKIESERERIDPAEDSLGRTRQQRSLEAMLETLVLAGLEWLATVPDFVDPLAPPKSKPAKTTPPALEAGEP